MSAEPQQNQIGLGSNARGILAGYIPAVILALAAALNNNTGWKEALVGILLISAAPIGAMIQNWGRNDPVTPDPPTTEEPHS